jgi:hypothetical protein
MDEINHAAITFVNQLRSVDKVLFVAFDRRIHVLTVGHITDKPAIYAAIYKAIFASGISLYKAVNFVTDLSIFKVPGPQSHRAVYRRRRHYIASGVAIRHLGAKIVRAARCRPHLS